MPVAMSPKRSRQAVVTMYMEFQGMDVILPAGHGLRVVMTESGEDYLAPACGLAALFMC